MKTRDVQQDPIWQELLHPKGPHVHFDGVTYDHERDGQRLAVQLGDVRRFMGDHEWHTLRAISEETGHPEASVSARLRDLRKRGHVIERECLQRGLWQYRMQP